MKYYDVTTKKEYTLKGEQKVVWLKVGTLKETDDNKRFLELHMFPETSFYVFEQTKKDNWDSK